MNKLQGLCGDQLALKFASFLCLSREMAKSHPNLSAPPENLIQPLPGEVVVGHTSGTELVLYEPDLPDKPPNMVMGTLFVTNYRCGFKMKDLTMGKVRESDD